MINTSSRSHWIAWLAGICIYLSSLLIKWELITQVITLKYHKVVEQYAINRRLQPSVVPDKEPSWVVETRDSPPAESTWTYSSS